MILNAIEGVIKMPLNGSGWLITVGAVGGSIGGFSGAALLFRFLNAKINKVDESKGKKIEKLNGEKQDKEMCNERFNHLSNSLNRVERKLDMGVVVAKDDLQRVVTKLDHGTEIQNTIQASIAGLMENIKAIYAKDEKQIKY